MYSIFGLGEEAKVNRYEFTETQEEHAISKQKCLVCDLPWPKVRANSYYTTVSTVTVTVKTVMKYKQKISQEKLC